MDQAVTGGTYKMIDGVRTRTDDDGFPIQVDAAGKPILKDGAYVRIADAPKGKAGTKSERA